MTNDKAGIAYWDSNWATSEVPSAFCHKNKSLDNYVNLNLHHYFTKLLSNKKGLDIIELGCATSIWPMYFSQYHAANVSGLDYSEIGCKNSRTLMGFYGVPGNIYCGDIFNPPQELMNQFDLVVSFGLVEHFENTSECLKACSRFLKPEGRLFTLIPNMCGLNGVLQKLVDKSVYDVHVPLNKKDLHDAHLHAGLNVLECDYFMSLNLSVVNSQKHIGSWWHQYLRRCLSIPSKLTWALEKYKIKIPKNILLSPYIVSIAEKTR